MEQCVAQCLGLGMSLRNESCFQVSLDFPEMSDSGHPLRHDTGMGSSQVMVVSHRQLRIWSRVCWRQLEVAARVPVK